MTETVLEKIRIKAKALNRKICLTESDDVRNLKAAEKLVATGYARPVLVGVGAAIEKLAKDKASYEGYRRLAGEGEARTTQKRIDMSADERRARYPWLDYDVPEEQQIIRKR